ncbi:MAG: hypothetical protein M1426_04055, partial [Patescibacteria group bacterium]|nr:hypothetical protein [Patescibacteria group bacterium]
HYRVSNLWPFLKLSIQEFSIALNSGEQNLGSLRGVSRQFPLQTVIRLMHNMYFFDAKLYGEIYFNIIFVLISWIIPIVALFSIKNIKKCVE